MRGVKFIKSTEVTLEVTCHTNFGDRVALVGSIPMLGGWDINKAVILSTSSDTYPLWTIRVDLPREMYIEYKYVIFEKGTSKNLQNMSKTPIYYWESLPNGVNRVIDTHGKKSITIEEEVGTTQSVEKCTRVSIMKHFKSNDFGQDFLKLPKGANG